MIEGEVDLLHKAKRSLRAAVSLFDEGFAEFAASRAYYSMFYCAKMLIELNGERTKTHGGVAVRFAKDYVATGLIAEHLHDYLMAGMETRHKGDYAIFDGITQKMAQLQIDRAAEFIEVTETYVKNVNVREEA